MTKFQIESRYDNLLPVMHNLRNWWLQFSQLLAVTNLNKI